MKKLLVLVVLLAVSCAPIPQEKVGPEWTTLAGSNLTMSVYRVTDREAGVVCWLYSSIEKGGIDCMPISDTRLGG